MNYANIVFQQRFNAIYSTGNCKLLDNHTHTKKETRCQIFLLWIKFSSVHKLNINVRFK